MVNFRIKSIVASCFLLVLGGCSVFDFETSAPAQRWNSENSHASNLAKVLFDLHRVSDSDEPPNQLLPLPAFHELNPQWLGHEPASIAISDDTHWYKEVQFLTYVSPDKHPTLHQAQKEMLNYWASSISQALSHLGYNPKVPFFKQTSQNNLSLWLSFDGQSCQNAPSESHGCRIVISSASRNSPIKNTPSWIYADQRSMWKIRSQYVHLAVPDGIKFDEQQFFHHLSYNLPKDSYLYVPSLKANDGGWFAPYISDGIDSYFFVKPKIPSAPVVRTNT